MTPLDRRLFFQYSAGAVGAVLASRGDWALAAPGSSVADLVPGKDPRLIVHTVQPVVLETPAALLAADEVTPSPLVFVRNCQPAPEIAADQPLAGWQIELAGHVDRPQAFDAGVLEKLPRHEVEMVVQCSGNGRSLFTAAAKTEGTQWGRGGMANVRFSGPRLADLLEHLKVKPAPAAAFVTASGRDEPKPGEMDFEHSLPLDEVLRKSLFALEFNGSRLPLVHGGPVRLITPGYYGTMQVKWVNRLSFDDAESHHTSHMPHYRTPRRPIEPGKKWDANFENSESNWRMKLKSVVLSPEPGASVAPGEVAISGVAFNDGEARIDAVLVSVDEGAHWQRVELDVPKDPYAWYRWRGRVTLPAGKQQIWARAVDALGRTQPLDGAIHWNPRGYTWNGVEKIGINVG